MDLSDELKRRADSTSGSERARIRGLWVGFVIWVLILLNAIRIGPGIIAHGFPLPIFIVGVLVDLLIAVVTLVALRNAIGKQRSRGKSKVQAPGPEGE